MSPSYRVRWEIDLDADTPEEAAATAAMIQRDPDSLATVFDVIDDAGQAHAVDVGSRSWQQQLHQAWKVAGCPIDRAVTHDGYTLTVRLRPDDGATLIDSGDWYGTLVEQRRNTQQQRPHPCDGNAEIVYRDRWVSVWWQPPADVPRGTEAFTSLRERVRGWYADAWHYVTVQITVTSTRPCCGSRYVVGEGSLGGVESDAEDYHAEVVGELLAEIE